MTRGTYLCDAPSTVLFELAEILDTGSIWEDIAYVMPKIGDPDITACRRQAAQGASPTEALLRIWGSKGYLVSDLYKIFGRLKLVKAMQVIRSLVDPKMHHLEQTCLSLPDPSSRPMSHVDVASNSTNQRGTEPSSAVYSRKSHATDPSWSVYTKKTQSGWSTLGDNEPDSLSGSVAAGLQNTLSVQYDEIVAATNNFAKENILGKGGYGTVYRGNWKHFLVAVKRIQLKKDSGAAQEKERLRQSLQELRTLAKFRHDNVLSLYGYSLDGPEPCLVYQFMANGSLEDRLLCRRGTAPLQFAVRFQIAEGVSCGLHFLHSIASSPIIHGDVKSANILLDKHFEPKLGDFGLCRDGQQEVDAEGKSPLIASHIKGTLAYLPPEFISSKVLSTKLDVYSFGVVLLEIATGLRAYSDNQVPHSIVDYVIKQMSEIGDDAEALIDRLADKKVDPPAVVVFKKFLEFSLLCSSKDRFARPPFSDVVVSLREIYQSSTEQQ